MLYQGIIFNKKSYFGEAIASALFAQELDQGGSLARALPWQ